MKPAGSIRRLFKELRLNASTQLDERVQGAISDALTESKKTKPAVVKPNTWRIVMRSRMTRFAAAAMIVIAVLIGINQFGGSIDGASISLADVLEQIRVFRPHSYTCTTQHENKTVTRHLMMFSPRRRREVFPDHEAYVQIFDFSQKPIRMLALHPDKQLAVEKTYSHDMEPRNDFDLFKHIEIMLDEHDDRLVSEELGLEEIEGKTAKVFHVPIKSNDWTIWADATTGAPIRVELVQPEIGRKVTFSEIRIDVDFDESLFSMIPPEGYALKRDAEPSEQDLIEGLRAVAVFLGGEFPPVLDWNGVMKVLRKHNKRNHLSLTEDEKKTLADKVRAATRFAGIKKTRKRDIRYAGAGVKLGDADTPILWYRPQGSGTYRVIYGDFHVADLDAEELPPHEQQ